MHSSILERTPVLSLTPDSISSLGLLDSTSLSELWGVFTKCKDSLKDGRRYDKLDPTVELQAIANVFPFGRLENLSWRLWFASERRSGVDESEASDSDPEVGWSDPEWTEATDSESEPEVSVRDGRSSSRRSSGAGAKQQVAFTTTSPERVIGVGADVIAQIPHIRTLRALSGGPHDRRPTPAMTGGSLQRMITDLTTLPALTAAKARSAINVPGPSLLPTDLNPSLRRSSAPENLATPAPLSLASPILTTSTLTSSMEANRKVDAKTQTTPSSSHRPSPASRSPASLRPMSMARSGSNRSIAKQQAYTENPSIKLPAPAIIQPNIAMRRNSEIARAESAAQLTRVASFEPRSFVKGFDTTAFDSRPTQGAIAPPPTPAPSKYSQLAPSPPLSAMKSANKPPTGKKIFFISSHSDSEDDASPSSVPRHLAPSLERRSPKLLSVSAKSATRASSRSMPADRLPTASTSKLPPHAPSLISTEQSDEWDDEEEDDDDASSGWGSEYSTDSETVSRQARPSNERAIPKPEPLFGKRATSAAPVQSQLKPRPPGLLSQLFHPGLMMDDGDRSFSVVDMSAASRKALPTLQTSKSAGVLTEQLRNKSFLRGAPAGTEMESSSEEEGEEVEDFKDEEGSETDGEGPQGQAVATALVRRQREQLEAAGPIAPPQTPRTTRRAMLATELSESLRRNLLWERQTRSRVMGAPVNPRFAPLPTHQVSASVANTSAAPPTSATQQQQQERRSSQQTFPPILAPPTAGLQPPPRPSATRATSPLPPMVRRHTTGTGLYLQGQMGKIAKERGKGRKSKRNDDLSEESESGGGGGGLSSFTGGLHEHGW